MKTFDEILSLANSELERINWSRNPEGLYEPIGYILSLGGKRIRPAITLMCANIYTEDIMKAIKPAIGLEIFHNFTLLHDDIMDRADVRRGKPTVHKKWNDNTAILSGDVMQIEAYKWIAETDDKNLKSVLDIFSKTAAEICEGQQFDMEFESRIHVTADEYIEMIRLKTAVLIAAGCQIGALIGGADVKDAELLYEFGKNIGLAFQLKDDLLDVYGNAKSFGKKIGGDILNNKKTYLLINALELAEDKLANELRAWLENNQTDMHEAKIKAVTDIFNRLGVRRLCEEKMDYFYQLACTNLAQTAVAEERKIELKKLAKLLMSRID